MAPQNVPQVHRAPGPQTALGSTGLVGSARLLRPGALQVSGTTTPRIPSFMTYEQVESPLSCKASDWRIKKFKSIEISVFLP